MDGVKVTHLGMISPSKTNHDWNFHRKVTTFSAERAPKFTKHFRYPHLYKLYGYGLREKPLPQNNLLYIRVRKPSNHRYLNITFGDKLSARNMKLHSW